MIDLLVKFTDKEIDKLEKELSKEDREVIKIVIDKHEKAARMIAYKTMRETFVLLGDIVKEAKEG